VIVAAISLKSKKVQFFPVLFTSGKRQDKRTGQSNRLVMSQKLHCLSVLCTI